MRLQKKKNPDQRYTTLPGRQVSQTDNVDQMTADDQVLPSLCTGPPRESQESFQITSCSPAARPRPPRGPTPSPPRTLSIVNPDPSPGDRQPTAGLDNERRNVPGVRQHKAYSAIEVGTSTSNSKSMHPTLRHVPKSFRVQRASAPSSLSSRSPISSSEISRAASRMIPRRLRSYNSARSINNKHRQGFTYTSFQSRLLQTSSMSPETNRKVTMLTLIRNLQEEAGRDPDDLNVECGFEHNYGMPIPFINITPVFQPEYDADGVSSHDDTPLYSDAESPWHVSLLDEYLSESCSGTLERQLPGPHCRSRLSQHRDSLAVSLRSAGNRFSYVWSARSLERPVSSANSSLPELMLHTQIRHAIPIPGRFAMRKFAIRMAEFWHETKDQMLEPDVRCAEVLDRLPRSRTELKEQLSFIAHEVLGEIRYHFLETEPEEEGPLSYRVIS